MLENTFSNDQNSTYKYGLIYNRDDFLKGVKSALGQYFDEYQELVFGACVLTTTEMNYQFSVKTSNEYGSNNKNSEGFLTIEDHFLPRGSAKSVKFSDTDTDEGEISGLVEIQKANIEDALAQYVLYWGEAPTQKLKDHDPIVALNKTGNGLSYEIYPDTIIPTNVTHLLVISKNEYGENSIGTSISLMDLGAPTLVGPLHSSTEMVWLSQNTWIDFDVEVKNKRSEHSVILMGYDANNSDSKGDGWDVDEVVEFQEDDTGRYHLSMDLNGANHGVGLFKAAIMNFATKEIIAESSKVMIQILDDSLVEAKALIDKISGGELVFSDGTQLTIPPDSLSENTEITIRKDQENAFIFIESKTLESTSTLRVAQRNFTSQNTSPMTLSIPITPYLQSLSNYYLNFNYYGNGVIQTLKSVPASTHGFLIKNQLDKVYS
ncbi:hypothetical protein WDW89_20815 [Deltaproteobacteria bacterium TL4]